MHSSRKPFAFFASAATLMLLAVGAQASTRYVPSQYSTIQDAISAAVSGDTILVAAGSYPASGSYPGPLIWASKNLTIRGAGAGQSFITPRSFQTERCLTIRNLSAASRIEGFTFQGGLVYGDYGGGIYCDSSSLTVANCTFQNNNSDRGGDGLYLLHGSPTITNCTFFANGPSGVGGGIYTEGSSATITKCAFSNNGALAGGAIYNDYGNPIVTSCTFGGNQAIFGGGIHNHYSNAVVTNCTFGGNSANEGGGMYNERCAPTVTNCAFNSNDAPLGGGGMINDYGSPTVTNCTFSGNSSSSPTGYGGGGMFNAYGNQTVINCIFWGDTGGGICGYTASAIVTYSDVQGLANAVPDANGNFAADPLFVDAQNGNLNLLPGSPCRDRGNNAVLSSPPFLSVTGGVLIDLDTCRRVSSGKIDLGAYEFQSLTDVSTQITITKGTPSYPDSTGSFTQTLSIKNTGGTNLKGPVSVILNGLSGYTLTSRTGVTSALTPAGRPYINSSFSLPPGQVVAFRLKFTRTSATATFSYTMQVADGIGTR